VRKVLIRDKDKPMASKFLMLLSVISVVLAIVGAVGTDFYLASTQWLLVAGVLAAWGVYLLLEAEYRS
jgi:pheromone shutdown protein TraB